MPDRHDAFIACAEDVCKGAIIPIKQYHCKNGTASDQFSPRRIFIKASAHKASVVNPPKRTIVLVAIDLRSIAFNSDLESCFDESTGNITDCKAPSTSFVIRWRPSFLLSVRQTLPLFKYGFNLLVANIVDTIYHNLENLIIGKKYPSEVLAFFTKGKMFV